VNPKARWGSHIRRSRDPKRAQHPFYRAILKYGPENFTLSVVAEVATLVEAQAAEIAYIAAEERPYNVSPGGEYDALVGPKIFWDRMYSSPEAFKAYRVKLSAALKKAGAEGRINPSALVSYNRAKSARERWRLQNRATRVAAKANKGHNRGGRNPPNGNASEVKAAWAAKPASEKKRHSMTSRKNARALWARRTDAQKAQVSNAIAETMRTKCAPGTEERKRLALAAKKGREVMDRSVQGPAASKGLKTFWAELKADPERYAAYMAARRKTLMETLERKKNARKDI